MALSAKLAPRWQNFDVTCGTLPLEAPNTLEKQKNILTRLNIKLKIKKMRSQLEVCGVFLEFVRFKKMQFLPKAGK